VKYDLSSPVEPTSETCQQILTHCGIHDGYRLGVTKVCR